MTESVDQRSLLVNAYLDGELDAYNSAAMSKRISDDPALLAQVASVEALRSAIRDKLPREPLPESLKGKIDSIIGQRPTVSHGPSWRALAASVVCAVILTSSATWVALRPASADRAVESIVDNHMRAVLSGRATDVASSDRHTVKPWFNERITQSPAIIDLSGQGFFLVGGRVDVVNTTPVPTLIYSRRLHLISLTALPLAKSKTDISVRGAIKGLNVVGWSDGENQYWATSDVNPTELLAFASSFEAALPKR